VTTFPGVAGAFAHVQTAFAALCTAAMSPPVHDFKMQGVTAAVREEMCADVHWQA
jgi:hypothetical protein